MEEGKSLIDMLVDAIMKGDIGVAIGIGVFILAIYIMIKLETR